MPELITRRSALATLASSAAVLSLGGRALAQGSAKLPIRIAWLPGTCGRLYAAQAFNLFAKHGLDASLIRFDSGPAMNAAFQSKSVDIGYLGVPGFIIALGATPMRIFMVENEADKAEGLVVRPQSGITSMKDLPGKRIGTPVGTTAWMGLVEGLAKYGIDQSAVHIIDMKVGVIVPAFTRGDVDGVYIWAPWMFDVQSQGGKLIATDSDWMVNGNLWVGTTSFLDQQGEAVERFLAAMDEATHMIATRRADVAKYSASQMGIPVAVADRLLTSVEFPSYAEQIDPKYRLSLNNSHGGLNTELRRYVGVFTKAGIVTRAPDLNNAIDPRFLLAYEKKK